MTDRNPIGIECEESNSRINWPDVVRAVSADMGIDFDRDLVAPPDGPPDDAAMFILWNHTAFPTATRETIENQLRDYLGRFIK